MPILYIGGVYGLGAINLSQNPGYVIQPYLPPSYTPPTTTTSPTTKLPPSGSPGLLTSTGGLQDVARALLEPFFDTKLKRNCVQILDPTNFDSEEDCTYYFPNPDIQTGRQVTIHKAVVVYRELGKVNFVVGCETYSSRTDSYTTVEKNVVINRKNTVKSPFPDFKIHTKLVSFVAQGERPAAYIRRSANNGPLSVIEFMLCGHANEGEIL